MEEKKVTRLSKAWQWYFSWSEEHGVLGEFISIYLFISIIQIPILLLFPDMSFLIRLVICITIAVGFNGVRTKFLNKERHKKLDGELHDLIQEAKRLAASKKIELDEETIKLMEGKTCIAVCRGCDMRLYTGDTVHKEKNTKRSYCGKCHTETKT